MAIIAPFFPVRRPRFMMQSPSVTSLMLSVRTKLQRRI
jgi:hypothetical protein